MLAPPPLRLLAAFTVLSGLLLTLTNAQSSSSSSYDLIILSATPAGIMAAVSNARLSPNLRTLILERTSHIGGLPANGLGATDITTRGATGGLFVEFVSRIRAHYVEKYGEGSQQVIDSQDGYHFEPSVAEKILEEFLAEAENVTVLTERQFDAEGTNLKWSGNQISQLTVTNRLTNAHETYSGKIFIDASYEGDLIGAANIPLLRGRESQKEYNEIGAGVIYKYWAGPEQLPESTHEGDDTIQAFNYRLTLTNHSSNVAPIVKPKNYNRTEYLSMIYDIRSGCHTDAAAAPFCPRGALPADEPLPPAGKKPTVPGMPDPAIKRLSNTVLLPNGKWDGNNQHKSFISTDLPLENWKYPYASWAWRDDFAKRLRDYTEGLMYFGFHDKAVPSWFRQELRAWGYAKDEYVDNNYFPRQVYVREGRRMKGKYIFTANDAVAGATIKRTSITASHYALDSHAVRKRERGRVHLDGFLSYQTAPYTVPMGVIIPDHRVTNLLAPVPVSGTHIGFSTLRMEPCWMALGQAAGTIAGEAIKERSAVGDVDMKKIQRSLLNQDAVLVWFPEIDGMTKEEKDKKQWELMYPAGSEKKKGSAVAWGDEELSI